MGTVLYNAVSLCFHGNEYMHRVLRLLVSIELFFNGKQFEGLFYRMKSNFKSSLPYAISLIQLWFHYSSTNPDQDVGEPEKFKSEALRNANPGIFSSFSNMCVLSSVVGACINSVFSLKKPSVPIFHLSLIHLSYNVMESYTCFCQGHYPLRN